MNKRKQSLIFALVFLCTILSITKAGAAAEPGTVKWSTTLGFNLGVPAVGDDGTVYVPHWYESGYLSAINPNGTLKWRYDAGAEVRYSFCAVGEDGLIYIWNYARGVEAITPQGTRKWTFDTKNPNVSSNREFWKYYTPPAIAADGTLYIIEDREIFKKVKVYDPIYGWVYDWICIKQTVNLLALTPDGELDLCSDITQGNDPTNLTFEPVIGEDGTIYFYQSYWTTYVHIGKVYALNPDGTLRWSLQLPFLPMMGDEPKLAIGKDGTLYVSLRPGTHFPQGNKVYAITSSGNLKWSLDCSDSRHSWIGSPVVDENNIYVIESGSLPNKVHAINIDGTLNWSKIILPYNESQALSSDCIAIGSDGTIYVGTAGYNTSLHALDPNDGSVLWTSLYTPDYTGRNYMCIGGDGTIYLRGGDCIYAINSQTQEPPNAPWPMYRHDARRTARARCNMTLLVVIPGINDHGEEMVQGADYLLDRPSFVLEIREVWGLSDAEIRERATDSASLAKQEEMDLVVNIDMDLENYNIEYPLPPAMNRWRSTSVPWAGRIANIVVEAFRDICPGGTCRLYAHSAGVDAAHNSIRESIGQPLFDDLNLLNGRTNANELKSLLESSGYQWWQVKVFTTEGDLWAMPWMSLSNYDADWGLAEKGAWVHLHCTEIGGETPRHSGLRDALATGQTGNFRANIAGRAVVEYEQRTVDEMMLKNWRSEVQ